MKASSMLSRCSQAGVGRDPVQPRAERASPFEPGKAAPGPKQGLLQRVFGVGVRAEHPVAMRLQLALERTDEPAERVPVPILRCEQQLPLARR